MSTYQQGIAAMAQRRPLDVRPHIRQAMRSTPFVGEDLFRFVTPSTVAMRIQELSGRIEAFMADVAKYAPTPERLPEWRTWIGQVVAWVQQWREFSKADWLDRMHVETDDQIDRYAARLDQLVAEFRTKWGGQLTAPAIVMPPPQPPSSFWRAVGIGTLVGLTTAGVLYLIKRSIVPPEPPSRAVLVAPSEVDLLV